MKLKIKLFYSIIISGIFTIIAVFVPMIPCRITPNIPNKIYKWTLCSLNTNTQKNITEYLGYTLSLNKAYLLVFIITFMFMVFLFYKIKKLGNNKK